MQLEHASRKTLKYLNYNKRPGHLFEVGCLLNFYHFQPHNFIKFILPSTKQRRKKHCSNFVPNIYNLLRGRVGAYYLFWSSGWALITYFGHQGGHLFEVGT